MPVDELIEIMDSINEASEEVMDEVLESFLKEAYPSLKAQNN